MQTVWFLEGFLLKCQWSFPLYFISVAKVLEGFVKQSFGRSDLNPWLWGCSPNIFQEWPYLKSFLCSIILENEKAEARASLSLCNSQSVSPGSSWPSGLCSHVHTCVVPWVLHHQKRDEEFPDKQAQRQRSKKTLCSTCDRRFTSWVTSSQVPQLSPSTSVSHYTGPLRHWDAVPAEHLEWEPGGEGP